MCSVSNSFSIRTGLGMDASHIFPQSVLAVIPLIGMWLLVLCPEPVLDMKQGFLFALGLSVRARICFQVEIEALRCISELQCEVDITGVLLLGGPFSFMGACTLPELTDAEPCPL